MSGLGSVPLAHLLVGLLALHPLVGLPVPLLGILPPPLLLLLPAHQQQPAVKALTCSIQSEGI